MHPSAQLSPYASKVTRLSIWAGNLCCDETDSSFDDRHPWLCSRSVRPEARDFGGVGDSTKVRHGHGGVRCSLATPEWRATADGTANVGGSDRPRVRLLRGAVAHVLVVAGPSIGFAANGLSVFVLLALGPRLLGEATYSSLAVAWTIVTIFGVGVATPGEQTVIRLSAHSGPTGAARRVAQRVAWLGVPLVALVCLALAGVQIPWLSETPWLVGVAIAVFGWVLIVEPRGELAGVERYRAFTAVLVVEAVGRLLLAGAAWVFPNTAAWWLSMAMGLPILVAAVSAVVINRSGRASAAEIDTKVPAPVPQPTSTLSEQSSITIVALMVQVVLNSAPLWLAHAATGNPQLAGQFVSAAAYMRIPVLIAGAFFTVALSQVSSAFARGDRFGTRRAARRHVGMGGALTTVAVAVLLAVSGPGLLILYGPGMAISLATLVVMGVATATFVVAYLITQVLLACRRSTAASLCWMFAGLVSTVLLWAYGDNAMAAALAVLAGVVVALVTQVGVARWRLLPETLSARMV